MSRRLLKPLLALASGPLLAMSVAAPAAAEHPELSPTPFEASTVGEDGCTYFETTGEASWPAAHPPEEPSVAVRGEAWSAVAPGPQPCLPVVPEPRQLEFIAYVDDHPVDEEVVPFENPGQGQLFDYELSLASPDGTAIDHLTVAVCEERRADGSSWSDRCDATATVLPGTPPQPDHCLVSTRITSDWGNGYVAEVRITAVEAISDWFAIITFPGDQAINQIWNAEATYYGSEWEIGPPPWSTPVPAGGSISFGFIVAGSSEPPPHVEVWADGRRCAQD